jgi:hypothetical protein
MKRATLVLLFAVPLFARQTPATIQNPLDKLRDQAKEVFALAGVPFSQEQEQSIALMIEDRRQASEQLFGQLMDFRGGPVQGQQQDRAVAGIKWMHDEFKKRLREYLTEDQLPVWERYEAGDGIGALDELIRELTGGEAPKQQTQFIRIVNNSFTAERSWFNTESVSTDVIQRAGIGAFHGNFGYEFKDEALNARNPFAHNKPPYQERTLNYNFSGPLIRNRLTANINGNHNVRENAGTVNATTLEGPYDLGIVNTYINRYFGGNVTYQFSDAHSFTVGTNYEANTRKNQGVGGFNMPQRAADGRGRFYNVYFTQTAVLSDKTLYRTNFNTWSDRDEQKAVSPGISIEVLGAFSSGGAPNNSEGRRRGYFLNNLFSHAGQRVSVKGGFDGGFRTSRTINHDNFLGSFTFSSLDDYRAGIAETYRINSGNPLLENRQVEMSTFVENDVKLSQRLTMMFGARYDYQTNLDDRNNLAPRLGFAYAIGRSTVVRGGSGIYYERLYDWIVENQKRSDGTRQYEIVLKNARYPNPFETGADNAAPAPSIRVTDPDLAAPYQVISSVSVERTFQNTLFISGRYEFRRGIHQFRSRDLNAPSPGQTGRPNPDFVNINNLESTGLSSSHTLAISARQRFSVFNVSGSYSFNSSYSDSDGYWSSPSNNHDLRLDWGRRTDPRHQVNSTVNAKLFMGVFLTGTMSANSGNLYNITTGNDDNGDTNINDRPPGVLRNSGDGPGFLSFSFNISKAFFIGGAPGGNGSVASSRANMNLYANMNNAFNRTNYGTPNGVMSSPSFGEPNSARNAREIEVGLRFQF